MTAKPGTDALAFTNCCREWKGYTALHRAIQNYGLHSWISDGSTLVDEVQLRRTAVAIAPYETVGETTLNVYNHEPIEREILQHTGPIPVILVPLSTGAPRHHRNGLEITANECLDGLWYMEKATSFEQLAVNILNHINLFIMPFHFEEWLPSDNHDELETGQLIAAKIRKTPNSLNYISDRDFEFLIAYLLHRQNYCVTVTKKSRDGGLDILATHKSPVAPMTFIVECKHYPSTRLVGVRAVRDLVGAMSIENASSGIIVTTSGFTKPAVEAAERAGNVFLRDSSFIHALIRDLDE